MLKKGNFIFSKKFDKAVDKVTKEDYSEIQKNLKKLAKESLEILEGKPKKI